MSANDQHSGTDQYRRVGAARLRELTGAAESRPGTDQHQRVATRELVVTELLGEFCALDQALRLHEVQSDEVRQVLAWLHDTLRRFGRELRFELAGYSTSLNGQLVAVSYTEYRRLQTLKAIWETFGIGGISFPGTCTSEALVELATLFHQMLRDPAVQASLFVRRGSGITVLPAVVAGMTEREQRPLHYSARVFCVLSTLTEDILERMQQGRRLPILPLKRVLHLLIDMMESHESFFVALTRVPALREGLAGHLVNTAILALAVGRRVGLDRVALGRLASAALLHDLPKLGLKDDVLNNLEQAESPPPADRERVERRWLAMMQQLVSLAELSEDMLARLVVLFESQLEFGCRELYGADTEQQSLSLLSRIVAACDAFDTLTWPREGKQARTTYWAMLVVLEQALVSGRLDANVIQALLEAVGLYATGSPALLNTGEIAVITSQRMGVPHSAQPRVQVVFDANGRRVRSDEQDLAADATRALLWPLHAAPLEINPVACLLQTR